MKQRLIWALAAAGLGFGAAVWYREYIFMWLLAPADGQLSPFDGLPVFTAPTQMLGATIQLGIYGGLAAALPVLAAGAYTLSLPPLRPRGVGLPAWLFWLRPFLTIVLLPLGIYTQLRAALSTHLRRVLAILLLSANVLFVAGIAFVYFVMLPVGLSFLLNFGKGVAVPLINLTQYLELLIQLMFWMGLLFEMPLAMYLFTRLGLIKYERFRSLRKFVPFAAIILGIIITPGTDFLNMLMVAVPFIVLYEAGLFLSRLARPRSAT